MPSLLALLWTKSATDRACFPAEFTARLRERVSSRLSWRL